MSTEMDHTQSVVNLSIETDPGGFMIHGNANGVNLVPIIKDKYQFLMRLPKEDLKFYLSSIKIEDLMGLRDHFISIYDKKTGTSTTLYQRKGLTANCRLSEDIYYIMQALVENKPIYQQAAKIVCKSQTIQDENDIDEVRDDIEEVRGDMEFLLSKMNALEVKVFELTSENKQLKSDLTRMDATLIDFQKILNKLNINTNSSNLTLANSSFEQANVKSNSLIRTKLDNNKQSMSHPQSPSASGKRSREHMENANSRTNNPITSKHNNTLFNFNSTADNPESTLTPYFTTFKDVVNKGSWNVAGSGKSKKPKKDEPHSSNITSKLNSKNNLASNYNRYETRRHPNNKHKKTEIIGTKTG